MGRFYKTAQPSFVDDNIFIPPWQLASQVIEKFDKEASSTEAFMLALNDNLKAEGLEPDRQRVQEKITDYQTKIEEYATQFKDNPLLFREKAGELRNLGREIQKDWTSGEIYTIQQNKALRDKYVKEHLERVKKDKGFVLQEDVLMATKFADEKFKESGGTNYKDGLNPNFWSQEDLNNYVDINARGEEYGKNFKANIEEKLGAYNKGGYIYKDKNYTELIEPERIIQGVASELMNDEELMSYYQQQMRLGLMTPEKVQEKILDTAKIMANKFAYKNISQGITSKTGDPFALKAQDLENNKSLHDYKKQKEAQDINSIQRTESVWQEGEIQNVFNSEKEVWREAKTLRNEINNLKKLPNYQNNLEYKEASAKMALLHKDIHQINELKAKREQYVKSELGKAIKENPEIKSLLEKYSGKSFSEMSHKDIIETYKLIDKQDNSSIFGFKENSTSSIGDIVNNATDNFSKFHMNKDKKVVDYISLEGENTKDFQNMAYQALLSGDIEVFRFDGKNPNNTLQVDNSGLGNNAALENMQQLMSASGATDIKELVKVTAMTTDEEGNMIVRGSFTPKGLEYTAKKGMAYNDSKGEIVFKVKNTNATDVTRGYIQKNNIQDPSTIPFTDPVFKGYVNEVSNIPNGMSNIVVSGGREFKVERIDGEYRISETYYDPQKDKKVTVTAPSTYDINNISQKLKEIEETYIQIQMNE